MVGLRGRDSNFLSALDDSDRGEYTWVECLPQVLDRLHDTPGEGGLSPYDILFGRERPLAGVPYRPPVDCEDSVAFFARMKAIDKVISATLMEKHAKRQEVVNRDRKHPPLSK